MNLLLIGGVALMALPIASTGFWVASSNDYFSNCPRAPLDGVHDHGRLTVIATCVYFEGDIVERDQDGPHSTGDGDLRYRLMPGEGVGGFHMGDDNDSKVVSACAPYRKCLYLEVPPIYQRFPRSMRVGDANPNSFVQGYGTFVFDSAHNWTEIHPVSTLKVF